jgi:hypothetical protein
MPDTDTDTGWPGPPPAQPRRIGSTVAVVLLAIVLGLASLAFAAMVADLSIIGLHVLDTVLTTQCVAPGTGGR